jgi:hypothetical protein
VLKKKTNMADHGFALSGYCPDFGGHGREEITFYTRKIASNYLH